MDSETIFRKAMASMNPEAIFEVARIFESMAITHGSSTIPQRHKAWQLYQRAYGLGQAFMFGAMARGTPIKGTNGAVIPPGRYWQDMSGDAARKAWIDWTVDHPEVIIEKSEYGGGGAGEPVTLSVIFTIPANANNYGLAGIWWPTTIMGFPSTADVTTQSKADTIQRPPPMTYADAVKEVGQMYANAAQSAVTYVAETAGKAAGSAAKGAGAGLGFSTTTMVLIGLGALAVIVIANKLSNPLTALIPHG